MKSEVGTSYWILNPKKLFRNCSESLLRDVRQNNFFLIFFFFCIHVKIYRVSLRCIVRKSTHVSVDASVDISALLYPFADRGCAPVQPCFDLEWSFVNRRTNIQVENVSFTPRFACNFTPRRFLIPLCYSQCSTVNHSIFFFFNKFISCSANNFHV